MNGLTGDQSPQSYVLYISSRAPYGPLLPRSRLSGHTSSGVLRLLVMKSSALLSTRMWCKLLSRPASSFHVASCSA